MNSIFQNKTISLDICLTFFLDEEKAVIYKAPKRVTGFDEITE